MHNYAQEAHNGIIQYQGQGSFGFRCSDQSQHL